MLYTFFWLPAPWMVNLLSEDLLLMVVALMADVGVSGKRNRINARPTRPLF